MNEYWTEVTHVSEINVGEFCTLVVHVSATYINLIFIFLKWKKGNPIMVKCRTVVHLHGLFCKRLGMDCQAGSWNRGAFYIVLIAYCLWSLMPAYGIKPIYWPPCYQGRLTSHRPKKKNVSKLEPLPVKHLFIYIFFHIFFSFLNQKGVQSPKSRDIRSHLNWMHIKIYIYYYYYLCIYLFLFVLRLWTQERETRITSHLWSEIIKKLIFRFICYLLPSCNVL